MPRCYTRPQERQRRQIRTILDRSRVWDAASMRISPNGEVTALKDPEKTMRTEAPVRLVVGHVSDMLPGEYR